MVDGGERVVEGVEEPAPLLVAVGASKALSVVLQGLPLDEEEVAVWVFEASLELVGDVAGRGGDDSRRLAEGGFEVFSETRADVEDGVFENHGRISLFRGSREGRLVVGTGWRLRVRG